MTRSRFVVGLLEATLLVAIAGTWLASWLAIRGGLDGLGPGYRNVLLGVWLTDTRIWGALVLGAIAVGALAMRHRIPTVAFVIASGAVVLFELWYPLFANGQFSSKLVLAITAFWALWKTARFWPMAALVLAVGAVVPLRNWRVQQQLADSDTIAFPRSAFFGLLATSVALMGFVVAGAWLIRRYERQRIELAERNRQLEDQRQAAAVAAVTDERLRIARELHDVVAHHVSTMTLHAGAARQVLDQDAEASAHALRQIEESGRDAINELTRLLQFLRDDEGQQSRTSVPSLRDIDRLVENSAGLAVDLDVTGDVTTIPPSVDVSAYRIIQEALTNATKHSADGRASVSIQSLADRVELRISNPSAAGNGEAVASGSGHGLLGMRERAALHRGNVSAGPDEDGVNWIVQACLPHEVLVTDEPHRT